MNIEMPAVRLLFSGRDDAVTISLQFFHIVQTITTFLDLAGITRLV